MPRSKPEPKFIIPNLYFSQAQLNILILCIFLAKALNAKDDKGNSIDCIFVDDPIQSMDSRPFQIEIYGIGNLWEGKAK